MEADVRRVHEGPFNAEQAGGDNVTIATITLENEGGGLAAGARSHVYKLLADAFSYPTDEFSQSLGSGDWSRQLSELAHHLPFDLSGVTEPAFAGATPDVLQQGYVSTFEVGIGQPYCPLYEGSHRSGRMKLMEELVRFYEHFGLKIQAGDHADHLCAELEFMHYMAFKEAAALAHSDPVPDVRRAQRDFLDRHLCRWLPRVQSRLSSAREAPAFYLSAVQFASEFCRQDLASLKSSVGQSLTAK
jgi:DMSO reductase family type II enzyme chaperone